MRRLMAPLLLAVLVATGLWQLHPRDESVHRALPARPPASSATPEESPGVTAATGAPSPTASTAHSDAPVPPAPQRDLEGEGTPLTPSAPALAHTPAEQDLFDRYTAAAAAALRAFARPQQGVTPRAWWAAVKPYLSEQATADYAGTDPRQVPFTKVTGAGVILPTDAPAHLLRVALVPTDAGDYLVEMSTDPTGIRITRITLGGPQ